MKEIIETYVLRDIPGALMYLAQKQAGYYDVRKESLSYDLQGARYDLVKFLANEGDLDEVTVRSIQALAKLLINEIDIIECD